MPAAVIVQRKRKCTSHDSFDSYFIKNHSHLHSLKKKSDSVEMETTKLPSSSSTIIGRQTERGIIMDFLNSSHSNTNVLYICGNPGTGKTALVKDIISSLSLSNNFINSSTKSSPSQLKYHFHYFNCMMYTSPSQVLSDIIKFQNNKRGKRGELSCLVLDEIDQLAQSNSELFQNIISHNKIYKRKFGDGSKIKNQSHNSHNLLYHQFSHSKLICIANNLNLTVKYDFDNVRTIYFVPYQIEEIQNILKTKLSTSRSIVDNQNNLHFPCPLPSPSSPILSSPSLSSFSDDNNDSFELVIDNETDNEIENSQVIIDPLPPFIDPMAIELCARKIAAIGDLRKALQIVNEVISFSSRNDGKDSISVQDMLSILNKYLAPTLPSSRLESLLSDLNIHQKLILISLLILVNDSMINSIPSNIMTSVNSNSTFTSISKSTLSHNSLGKITLKLIYEKYQHLSKYGIDGRKVVDSITKSDFYDICSNLESIGLINMISEERKGNYNNKKMSNQRDSHEISTANRIVKITWPINEFIRIFIKQDSITRSLLESSTLLLSLGSANNAVSCISS